MSKPKWIQQFNRSTKLISCHSWDVGFICIKSFLICQLSPPHPLKKNTYKSFQMPLPSYPLFQRVLNPLTEIAAPPPAETSASIQPWCDVTLRMVAVILPDPVPFCVCRVPDSTAVSFVVSGHSTDCDIDILVNSGCGIVGLESCKKKAYEFDHVTLKSMTHKYKKAHQTRHYIVLRRLSYNCEVKWNLVMMVSLPKITSFDLQWRSDHFRFY